jgi:hypothetical protein
MKMMETKTIKKVLQARNMLRTLRLDSIFRRPLTPQENRCSDSPISGGFGGLERNEQEKAWANAEYTKAEAMTSLQRQRYI